MVALDAVTASERLALFLTALWAVYNAGIVGLAVRAVWLRSHRRSAYRFERSVPVGVKELDSRTGWVQTSTVDLNPDGVSFYYPTALALGEHVSLAVAIPGARVSTTTAVVMNARALDVEHQPGLPDRRSVYRDER
jgi:hypothetical protein